jgi:spore coat polysaccharide biosynthesis protein SpsF
MPDWPSVGIILQARMGSTRLSGKVMEPIVGRPMLERELERISRLAIPHRSVVATTTVARDDVIVELCESLGVPSFRGSEDDVLGRFEGAARRFGLDPIVRLTADCPLVDPEVVEAVCRLFLDDGPCDYASNTLVRTFPRGLDVEIFSRASLERASREADTPGDREHVTAFIYRHPERFRLRNHKAPTDWSGERWTVDTAEDLALVRAVYDRLYPRNPRFDMHDVLALLDREPDLRGLNAAVTQRPDPEFGDAEPS